MPGNRKLMPVAPVNRGLAAVRCAMSDAAMAHYDPSLRAAASGADVVDIGIYGEIGNPLDDASMTGKKMAGILRSAGGKDVVVNINSPGGDVFEGLAVYNMLRGYDGKVTANILGIAASAASFVAQAADTINVGKYAYMMIHNAWTIAAGNKEQLRQTADWLDQADGVIAGIYAARSGQDVSKYSDLMTAESYLVGQDVIDAGLADSLLPADAVSVSNSAKRRAYGARQAEQLLRAEGLSKADAQRIIAALSATLRDAGGSDPSASDSPDNAELQTLINIIQGV